MNRRNFLNSVAKGSVGLWLASSGIGAIKGDHRPNIIQILKVSEQRLRKLNGSELVATTINTMRHHSNDTEIRKAVEAPMI